MFRLTENRRLQQSGWIKKTFLVLGILCCAGTVLIAQTSYHHLVMGSYKTFEKASQAMPQIEQVTGSKSVVLFPDSESDWYRVSAYQSVNRAEVEGFSRSLQSAGKPKGWILTLNPSTAVMRSAAQTDGQNSGRRVASVATGNASRYHLIMGSFQTYEKAEEELTSLKSKGLEPYIVFPTGNVQAYRVSVYTADERSEVQAYATMLGRSGHSGAWILEEASTSTSQSIIGASSSTANARVATASGATTYYLIGGSFKRYDEATEYMDAARSMGATPEILWPANGEQGNFRVSLKSSKNRAEVDAFKQQLEAGGNNSSWILAK